MRNPQPPRVALLRALNLTRYSTGLCLSLLAELMKAGPGPGSSWLVFLSPVPSKVAQHLQVSVAASGGPETELMVSLSDEPHTGLFSSASEQFALLSPPSIPSSINSHSPTSYIFPPRLSGFETCTPVSIMPTHTHDTSMLADWYLLINVAPGLSCSETR